MMDDAGAFWASISAVQGDEHFRRSVSCEKHFDFAVVRQEIRPLLVKMLKVNLSSSVIHFRRQKLH